MKKQEPSLSISEGKDVRKTVLVNKFQKRKLKLNSLHGLGSIKVNEKYLYSDGIPSWIKRNQSNISSQQSTKQYILTEQSLSYMCDAFSNIDLNMIKLKEPTAAIVLYQSFLNSLFEIASTRICKMVKKIIMTPMNVTFKIIFDLFDGRGNSNSSNQSSSPNQEVLLRVGERTDDALTIDQFLRQHTNLIDINPDFAILSMTTVDPNLLRQDPTQRLFPSYISSDDVKRGLDTGELLQGTLEVYKHATRDAEVIVSKVIDGADPPFHHSVLIKGRKDQNRAFHGDTVVIQLYNSSMWQDSFAKPPLIAEEAGENEGDNDGGTIIGHTILSDQAVAKRPTGFVVAILKGTMKEYVAYIPNKENQVSNLTPATVEVDGHEEAVLVCPTDKRIPKIRIRTRQRKKIENSKLLVRVIDWPANSAYPNGQICRILGDELDRETEVTSLLLQNDLSYTPFSINALACLPVVPNSNKVVDLSDDVRGIWTDSGWKVPSDEFNSRKDMRHSHLIFSVDPSGCQDIDDAMSVKWLKDGLVEVTVCIADVCAFVPLNSPLDLEARLKSTTIYLSHKRFDMLPSILSSDIASLQCGRDRLAVGTSWIVRVTHAKSGLPIKSSDDFISLFESGDLCFAFESESNNDNSALAWFGRCIIRSAAAMTYEQAHMIIQGKDPNVNAHLVPCGQAGQVVDAKLLPNLRRDLGFLTVFSRFLKQKRVDSGSLEIVQAAGAELRFSFDAEGNPMAAHGHEDLEIHGTVAELMILANSTVAQVLETITPKEALLRVHGSPVLSKFDDIDALMKEMTQSNDGAAASQDLRSLIQECTSAMERKLKRNQFSSDPDNSTNLKSFVELVHIAVVKALSEAKYACSGQLTGELSHDESSGNTHDLKGHYGLGLRHYTHFTSPIRRYADVVVHRQLLYVLHSIIRFHHSSSVTGVTNHMLSEFVQNQNKIQVTQSSVYKAATVSIPDSQLPTAIDMAKTSSGLDSLIAPIPEPPALTFDFPTLSNTNSRGSDIDLQMSDLLDMLLLEQAPLHTLNQTDSLIDSLLNSTSQFYSDTSITNADELIDNLLRVEVPGINEISTHIVQVKHQVDIGNTNTNTNTHESFDIKMIKSPFSSAQVDMVAKHMNEMHRRAKRVQEDCQRLFLHLYLQKKVEVCNAIIYSVRSNGFLVFIPSLNIKGPVYLLNVHGEPCVDPIAIGLQNITDYSPKQLSIEFLGDLLKLSYADQTIASLSLMQEVTVQISAASHQFSPTAAFKITLMSVSKFLNSANVKSQFEPSNQSTHTSASKPVIVTKVATQETQTIFNLLSHNNRVHMSHRKPKPTPKVLTRLCVSGSGRICFGNNVDSVSPLFKSQSKSRVISEEDTGASSLGRGIAAARRQMAVWGEEWAKEEDLPAAYSNTSSSAGGNISGISREVHKEISISLRREQKLKIAKKNTKYNGKS